MFNFYAESTQLGLDRLLVAQGCLRRCIYPKYIFPLEKVIFFPGKFGFSLVALLVWFCYRRGYQRMVCCSRNCGDFVCLQPGRILVLASPTVFSGISSIFTAFL